LLHLITNCCIKKGFFHVFIVEWYAYIGRDPAFDYTLIKIFNMKKRIELFAVISLSCLFFSIRSSGQQPVSIVQSIPLNVNVIPNNTKTFTYKVLIFDCSTAQAHPTGQPPPPPEAQIGFSVNIVNAMNELGNQGYELVTTTMYHAWSNNTEQCLFVFKKANINANAAH
jgi:hypothetical protein